MANTGRSSARAAHGATTRHGVERSTPVLDRAAALGARFSTTPVAVVGGLVIVALAVLGMWRVEHPDQLKMFDLDGERNHPARWSATLLVLAGGGALINGAVRALGVRWRWNMLGLLFLFMAVDEWTTVHESLEERSGVDWQILYAPLFLLAGIAALGLLSRLRAVAPALQFFLGGSAAWGVSQVLERLQWSGDVRQSGYNAFMVTEEVLEMTGSLLFVLTALVAFRWYARGRMAHSSH